MRPRAAMRTVRTTALGLLMATLAGASASAGEPRGMRWVGPETILYAEAPHPETVLDRVAQERVSGLLKAVPGYQAALAKPEVIGGRFVAGIIAAGLGTTPETGLRDLIGGGVVLAVEGDKAPDKVYMIVTPKDLSLLERTHARLLEFVRSDAKTKKKPDPVTEAEHRGIRTYSLAPAEAHAIVSGSLVIANSPALLKAVIDRALDPGAKALADDPNFEARRQEADPEAFAWAYARTERLRAIDPKKYGGQKPDAGALFLLGPWIEGATKGDWACASLTWTDSRLGAELVIAEPKGGYSSALKRYLPGKDRAASRPRLPKGALGGATLWRDFSSIWDVRAEIFPPETVQGLAQLDTQAGTFFGGRDFATGVLGALGDRWGLVIADQDFDRMDPAPDTKLPAFAVLLELKPDDPEFAARLMAAFQSFQGLVNLGAAQTKAPPLIIGSETVDGLMIATSHYQPPYERVLGEPIDARYNFSPSAVQVGDTFVISSSLGLARELAKSLKEPAQGTDSTLVAEADGRSVARFLERNRGQLVMQNMLSKGNDKPRAEGEIGLILEVLRYVGRGALTVKDRPGSAALKLEFALDSH